MATTRCPTSPLPAMSNLAWRRPPRDAKSCCRFHLLVGRLSGNLSYPFPSVLMVTVDGSNFLLHNRARVSQGQLKLQIQGAAPSVVNEALGKTTPPREGGLLHAQSTTDR